jgi:hypothetical protein
MAIQLNLNLTAVGACPEAYAKAVRLVVDVYEQNGRGTVTTWIFKDKALADARKTELAEEDRPNYNGAGTVDCEEVSVLLTEAEMQMIQNIMYAAMKRAARARHDYAAGADVLEDGQQVAEL